MFESILYQRLEDQRRNRFARDFRSYVDLHSKPVPETRLLNI
jgi:hypothetical protein